MCARYTGRPLGPLMMGAYATSQLQRILATVAQYTSLPPDRVQ
jgi:hypothetical protein